MIKSTGYRLRKIFGTFLIISECKPILLAYTTHYLIESFEESKFNVYGSLIINGNLNLQGQDIVVDKNLTQIGGTVSLGGGNLNVRGDFNQNNGTIDIDKGTLRVKGDYSISDSTDSSTNCSITGEKGSTGILKMTNPEDRVFIGKSFTTGSTNSSQLTNGELIIKGNFLQLYSYNNFCATENHKTILCGEGIQNVSFSNSNCKYNKLIAINSLDNISFNRQPCWNELISAIFGNTNLDSHISIGDVTAIQRHLAELEIFTDEQLVVADTNGDGKVDIDDATHLQKYIAEYNGIVLGMVYY